VRLSAGLGGRRHYLLSHAFALAAPGSVSAVPSGQCLMISGDVRRRLLDRIVGSALGGQRERRDRQEKPAGPESSQRVE
jgi:hypothetical protein